jgi:hypothetical protein
MPKVTIYIRNDDWENWSMIEDVPEFVRTSIAAHTARITAKEQSIETSVSNDPASPDYDQMAGAFAAKIEQMLDNAVVVDDFLPPPAKLTRKGEKG